MELFFGIFIGMILFTSSILIIIIIIKKMRYTKYKNNFMEKYNALEPLVNVLIENGIIKNGIKFLNDVEKNCVYVLVNNELRKYIYKTDTDFIHEATIVLSIDIFMIMEKYINWNVMYGLNSMFGHGIRFLGGLKDFNKYK